MVSVLATMRDKHGKNTLNLNKDDFVLEEDERPQTITSFARESGLPLRLGLLVDTTSYCTTLRKTIMKQAI